MEEGGRRKKTKKTRKREEKQKGQERQEKRKGQDRRGGGGGKGEKKKRKKKKATGEEGRICTLNRSGRDVGGLYVTQSAFDVGKRSESVEKGEGRECAAGDGSRGRERRGER